MITVIVCSLSPQRLADVERMYRTALAPADVEFIGISDAKSLAEAYNRGAATARGETIIFSHDDVEILSSNLAGILEDSLRNHDLIGVAGTDRLIHPQWFSAGPPFIFGQVLHPRPPALVLDIFGIPRRSVGNIQAIDGLFMAARREVVREIGFDAAAFDGFHLYDIDFSYRAFQAGKRIVVRCDIHLLHASRGTYEKNNFPIYGERFMTKHGATLEKSEMPHMQWAGRVVHSVDEARALMTPRYWKD